MHLSPSTDLRKVDKESYVGDRPIILGSAGTAASESSVSSKRTARVIDKIRRYINFDRDHIELIPPSNGCHEASLWPPIPG